MPIVKQGHFTGIGMRTKVEDKSILVINTCSGNDTSDRGTFLSWSWCNPTNRAVTITIPTDPSLTAVSPESAWQGTKMFSANPPDQQTLAGQWRRNKGKRPIGAWNGPSRPLICDPGEARRRIYIPSYDQLIQYWLKDTTVISWIDQANRHPGGVYLRDHDTGRGIDRRAPMSHAWLLAEFLNHAEWPD